MEGYITVLEVEGCKFSLKLPEYFQQYLKVIVALHPHQYLVF